MYKQSSESDSDSSMENSNFLDGPLSKMHLQKNAAPVKKNKAKDTVVKTLFINKNFEKKTSPSMNVAKPVEDDDLGFDPKQPKRTQKSMNLFADLLKQSNPTNDNRTTISRQSTATTTDSSNIFNVSRPKTTAGRRSSSSANQQEVTKRPITSNQETTKSVKSPRKATQGTTANWLGLDLEIVESIDSVNKSIGQEDQPPQQSTSSNKTGRTYDIVFDEAEKSSSNKTGRTYDVVFDDDSKSSSSEPIESKESKPPQQSTSSNKTGRTYDIVFDEAEKSSSNKTGRTYDVVFDDDSESSSSEPIESKESKPPQQSTSSNKTGRTYDIVFDEAEKSSSNKTGRTYDVVFDDDSESSSSEPIESKESKPQESEIQISEIPNTLPQLQQQDNKIHYLLQKQAKLLKHQEEDYEIFIEKHILSHKKFKKLDEKKQRFLTLHFSLIKLEYHKLIKASLFPNVTHEIKQGDIRQNLEVCSTVMDACQKDIEIKRLQLENQRLEALLANVNANTAREIEALNASHKIQTTILEEHCAKLENYFRQETDTKAKYYEEKIEQMMTENKEQREYYERSLMLMRNSHEKDKKLIGDIHSEHMEILTSTHQKIMEILQDIHNQETALRQEKNSYGKILQESANSIDVLNKNFNEFKQEMLEKVEIISKERDHQLSLREKQLESTERMLKEAYEKSKLDNARLKNTIGDIHKDYEEKLQEQSENEDCLKVKKSELLKRESELSQGFLRLDTEKSAFHVYQTEQVKDVAQRVAQLDEECAKLEEEKRKFAKILENHRLEKKQFERKSEELQKMLNNAKLEKSKLDEDRAQLLDLKNTLNEFKEELEKNKNEVQILKKKKLDLEKRTEELNKREEYLTSQKAELCHERVKLLQKSKQIETGLCVLCRLHVAHAKVDARLNDQEGGTHGVLFKFEQRDSIVTGGTMMFLDNSSSDTSA